METDGGVLEDARKRAWKVFPAAAFTLTVKPMFVAVATALEMPESALTRMLLPVLAKETVRELLVWVGSLMERSMLEPFFCTSTLAFPFTEIPPLE